MTDYSKRDAFEAKTHQLFDEYFKIEGNWTPSTAVIGFTFKAMHHAALSAKRVYEIGNALGGIGMGGGPTQIANALTTLCRAKILRSYSKGGERLYEVNY